MQPPGKIGKPVKNASEKFWQGKRVLLTGHTGFKGAWMAIWLNRMGAQVTGISLPPTSNPNLFALANIDALTDSHFIDIRNADALSNVIENTKPEIVFHLAAQALVRASYKDPLTTLATNIMGTANVLNALLKIDTTKVVVAVTTDKVYENLESGHPYKEDDKLGGYEPYSASKAAAEIVISCYQNSFLKQASIALASARAGNVIGGGDWSEDRLIPDAIRAWTSGLPLLIRNPNAVRPWQHVLEPLNGYLLLAEKIYKDSSLAEAYNFGPNPHEAATVGDVIKLANGIFGSGNIVWGEGINGPHEAGLLNLDITKASMVLGAKPRWTLNESVSHTMEWYKRLGKDQTVYSLCDADISAFINTKK